MTDAVTVEKIIEIAKASNLPPHATRMITELEELNTKTEGLKKFIGTPAHASLSADERDDQDIQLCLMTRYVAILKRRLARACSA